VTVGPVLLLDQSQNSKDMSVRNVKCHSMGKKIGDVMWVITWSGNSGQ